MNSTFYKAGNIVKEKIKAQTSQLTSSVSRRSDYVDPKNMVNPDASKIRLISYRTKLHSSEKHSSKAEQYDENDKVDLFLASLNWSKNDALATRIGNKFIAYKCDVQEALLDFRKYETTRKLESVYTIWLAEPRLIQEIRSPKFRAIPVLTNNPLILIFKARCHNPETSPVLLTMRAFMCNLDALVESNSDANKRGIIFIIDMTDTVFEKFDYMLIHKFQRVLRDACTVQLKAVYVVNVPTWYHSIFKVLFVDSGRMQQLLEAMFPPQYMPANLFKSDTDVLQDNRLLQVPAANDHSSGANEMNSSIFVESEYGSQKLAKLLESWPARCINILTDVRYIFLQRHYTLKRPVGYHSSMSRQPKQSERQFDDNISARFRCISFVQLPGFKDHMRECSMSNEHMSTPQTFYMAGIQEVTVRDFVAKISQKKLWEQLDAEFKSVESLSYRNYEKKDIRAFRDKMNASKNRYSNIVCLELSRVVLHGSMDGNDYIHANFVDSALHPRALINTQGPMHSTTGDFWQMVWEQHSYIVVMVTRMTERNESKCYQYWPKNPNREMKVSETLTVRNVTSESALDNVKRVSDMKSFNNFDVTVLELVYKNTDSDRGTRRYKGYNSIYGKDKLAATTGKARANYGDGSVSSDTRLPKPRQNSSSASFYDQSGHPTDYGQVGGADDVTVNGNSQSCRRIVYHFKYNGWPDHDVPKDVDSLLNMRRAMRLLQASLVKNDETWHGHRFGPPAVIHCSAGIGRTGTFSVIDICLSSLEIDIVTSYVNNQLVDTRSDDGLSMSSEHSASHRSPDYQAPSIPRGELHGASDLRKSNGQLVSNGDTSLSGMRPTHLSLNNPTGGYDEMDTKILSIPEVLMALRSQRAHSVQNARQYSLCYECVFRYITTRLSSNTTKAIMKHMSHDIDVSSL